MYQQKIQYQLFSPISAYSQTTKEILHKNVFYHSDIIFFENSRKSWVSEKKSRYESDTHTAICGGVSNWASWEQVLDKRNASFKAFLNNIIICMKIYFWFRMEKRRLFIRFTGIALAPSYSLPIKMEMKREDSLVSLLLVNIRNLVNTSDTLGKCHANQTLCNMSVRWTH